MSKKIYVTKKRDEALNVALSIDDYLYEKHRRWQERFNRDVDRLWRKPKEVFDVVGSDGEVLYKLQIKEVQMTENGSRIVVELPAQSQSTKEESEE